MQPLWRHFDENFTNTSSDSSSLVRWRLFLWWKGRFLTWTSWAKICSILWKKLQFLSFISNFHMSLGHKRLWGIHFPTICIQKIALLFLSIKKTHCTFCMQYAFRTTWTEAYIYCSTQEAETRLNIKKPSKILRLIFFFRNKESFCSVRF